MTSMALNFGAVNSVKFEYVGLKSLKVHHNIINVSPLGITNAPRNLRVKADASENELEPKLAAPAGTPAATFPLSRRPHWNHLSPTLKAGFQETTLSPANLVYPLFIHEGEEDNPIRSMPGCYMLGWRHGLVEEVAKARDVGINSIVLFPKIPDALKTPTGDESYNENGLLPRTIRLLKDKYPDLIIYSDVALDLYSSDSHDGIVRDNGFIMNDETVFQLCKQAVALARAGVDVVSPSDMMNGRVGAIRASLDAEGFQHVSIMSCIAEYVSPFYGPFTEALGSNSRLGDKKISQINPKTYREALLETREAEAEGADILVVKPGLPRLDIIQLVRDNSSLPIAAFQVSGEYSIIKAAISCPYSKIDEERAIMESLTFLRRSGASIILTYFALQIGRCLSGEKKFNS